MRSRSLRYVMLVVARGLHLRCPACGFGRLFRRLHLRETCPYCRSRFERASGESMGAVYINTLLTVTLAVVGFFTIESMFDPPLLPHAASWFVFLVVFPLVTYRPVRGLWISITHLTTGIYPDPDYEREWLAPAARRQRNLPAHWPEDPT